LVGFLAEDWPEGTLFANYARLQIDNARQFVEAARKAAVEAAASSRAPQMTTEFLHVVRVRIRLAVHSQLRRLSRPRLRQLGGSPKAVGNHVTDHPSTGRNYVTAGTWWPDVDGN
jgi:hypothetical protein